MSVYHAVAVICGKCGSQNPPENVGINNIGGIRLTTTCGKCSFFSALDTTFDEMLRSCQLFELDQTLDQDTDLAEIICNGPPH